MSKEFTVRFNGNITLSTADVWPDDDAPDAPTAADVKVVMEKCGSKDYVLRDWCLTEGLRVHVGSASPGPEVEVWL